MLWIVFYWIQLHLNILFAKLTVRLGLDNHYPYEVSPSPTFTQMDPYKPQCKVKLSD